MHKYYYHYIIYKNDFPVYYCDNIKQIAKFLNKTTNSVKVQASNYQKKYGTYNLTYCYYDNKEKCFDYSQKYLSTRHYEIYRFWNSEN